MESRFLWVIVVPINGGSKAVNGAFYIGAVGLDSQQRALDTLANNIANINTPTFKRSDMRFTEIMASRVNELDAPQLNRSEQTVPGGVVSEAEFLLFEQGQLQSTGRSTDLAINGPGFIELLGPSGQTYLWRGGSLKVNSDGQLAASNGMALRALITVPNDVSEVEINSSGEVRGVIAGDQQPVDLGQISLVRIDHASQLQRLDGGLYSLEDGVPIKEAVPGEDGIGLLVQGSIEGSNVALNEEMAQMMIVQRAFASNAQLLQAADQMMAITNSLRR